MLGRGRRSTVGRLASLSNALPGRPLKRYSDEEFALILRKAGELGRGSDEAATSAGHLTLPEMKAIAAEAGLDPALVARAARLMSAESPEVPSGLERALGAPSKVRMAAEYDLVLDPGRAEQLLAVIRAAAGQQGEGEVTGSAVSWHSVGEGTQYLATIHSEGGSTRLQVTGDRRGAIAIAATFTGLGSLAAGIVVLLLGEMSGIQAPPAVGLGLVGAAAGSVVAAGRAAFKASTRGVRARVADLLESVGRSLDAMSTEAGEDGDADQVPPDR